MKTMFAMIAVFLTASLVQACDYTPMGFYGGYGGQMGFYGAPTTFGGVYGIGSTEFVDPGVTFAVPSYSRTLIRYGYNRNLFFNQRFYGNRFFNQRFDRRFFNNRRFNQRFFSNRRFH